MEAKIVKVTDKGQISIPRTMRLETGITKGDEIIMISDNNTLIIEKLKDSRFKDLIKHSERVAQKIWNNKKDEVWDDV